MWKICVLSVYPCCMPRRSARFHVYIYRHPFGALTFPTYVHLRSHQLLISSSSAAALCTQRCQVDQVVTSTYHVKEFLKWKKLSYHPRAWYSPIFRNPVARYQGEQAAPFFSEHLKLCRTQPCVRGPVVGACWTPWSTPSQLAASGMQWSHELVHSVSQCQPMTKTCGSSGQTKRTAHVPNCIYARTF